MSAEPVGNELNLCGVGIKSVWWDTQVVQENWLMFSKWYTHLMSVMMSEKENSSQNLQLTLGECLVTG